MNYDELRPLKWHHGAGAPGWHIWFASTPVCAYKVVQWNDRFRWDYAYYSHAESRECDSLEAGMEAAWTHWKSLVRQIIEPVGPEGQIFPTKPSTPLDPNAPPK